MKYKFNRFKTSIQWIVIKFFLAIPSKHVRQCFLNCFKEVNIHKSVPIYSGFKWWKGKLEIGEGSSIGFCNHIDCRRGVVIGKNVCMATGVYIWTLHHDYNDSEFSARGGQVYIGDFCWLCSKCIVLPGVSIGEGAVVAAGAVVTSDVDPWTVVGGVPARKIGNREKKQYNYKPGDFWIPFV